MSKRLAALYQKQEQIKAQIRDAESRERDKTRKDDTRRKIILGVLMHNHMNTTPESELAKKCAALLDEYVTKPRERALFGLQPLPQDVEAKARPD
jgi:large subunit ribosomal protein L7/L12